jgi:hypothetical protein
MSLARRTFRRLRREQSTARSAEKLDRERGGQGSSLVVEIVESMLLAVVAVLTAYSGYQSSLWDSRSVTKYEQASQLDVDAQAHQTLAGQQMLYDATTFGSWLQAKQAGNETLAAFMERRFRPEYLPAFNAWLATDPFHNPSAPPGPAAMPEYRLAAQQQATSDYARAEASVNAGNRSRGVSDQYVRSTVLLAVVLFLTALSQRFSVRGVRMALVGVAVVVLGYSIVFLATISG